MGYFSYFFRKKCQIISKIQRGVNPCLEKLKKNHSNWWADASLKDITRSCQGTGIMSGDWVRFNVQSRLVLLRSDTNKKIEKSADFKEFSVVIQFKSTKFKIHILLKKISQMLTLKNFQLPSNSISSDFHQTLSAATNCNWKILDGPTLYFWGNFSQFQFYLRSLSRCWQDKVEAANMPGLISRKCGQRYKLCPPA